MGNLSVPGVPAWLTASAHAPRCLFATLVDTGSVASFHVTETGAEMSGEPVASGGAHPVHASVSADGGVLLVANYHGPDDVAESRGASVASFRIAADCSLTQTAVVPHSGSSVVRARQASAHPHSFSAARGGLAYACDLGQDAIFTYRLGPDGSLTELQRTQARPGDGPRHLVQHPSRPLLYVVNELANSVTAYAESEGALTALASTSTLPPGAASEGSKAAGIAIAPDGSAVYASNRGQHNSICVFEVLPDGSLRQLGHAEAPAFPRGIALAHGGSVLLVAGQHNGVLQTFLTRAQEPGLGLAWTGTAVPGPPTTAALAVLSLDDGPAETEAACGSAWCIASAPSEAGATS